MALSDEQRTETNLPETLTLLTLQAEGIDSLVEACHAGSTVAMQLIYERTSERVYGLMVQMVGRQDADDLTQQVFLQMFSKLEKFKGQSKLETWLYRLATNEALQHLRRQKRHVVGPLVWEPAADDPDPLIKSEESRLLQVALSRLEPELRAIFLLKEQQKLFYREISESLEIPAGNVGSRLNRARNELREELTKLGWE